MSMELATDFIAVHSPNINRCQRRASSQILKLIQKCCVILQLYSIPYLLPERRNPPIFPFAHGEPSQDHLAWLVEGTHCNSFVTAPWTLCRPVMDCLRWNWKQELRSPRFRKWAHCGRVLPTRIRIDRKPVRACWSERMGSWAVSAGRLVRAPIR